MQLYANHETTKVWSGCPPRNQSENLCRPPAAKQIATLLPDFNLESAQTSPASRSDSPASRRYSCSPQLPRHTQISPAREPPLLCAVEHGRDVLGESSAAASREYLITNGIGGYGSASLAGSLTRSYHGLLVGALKPPLDRTLLLAALDDVVEYLGKTYFLGPRPFLRVTPQGAQVAKDSTVSEPGLASPTGSITSGDLPFNSILYSPPHSSENITTLESFRLEGTTPVFTYAISDALLEKRLFMKHGNNAIFVRYKLVRASQPVELTLHALVNHRNHHGRTLATSPGFTHEISQISARTVLVQFNANSDGGNGDHPTNLILRATRGNAELANEWVVGRILQRERERGLPDVDHHLHAASFSMGLLPGGTATIVGAAVDEIPDSEIELPSFIQNLDGDAELEARRRREADLVRQFLDARYMHLNRRAEQEHQELKRLNARSRSVPARAADAQHDSGNVQIFRGNVESAVAQLALAADQFIIDRGSGKSIIAGYHWFSDWSRDAMVALSGLTICTGRLDVAKSILLTFANFVSRGMLPNRFPDDGTAPSDQEYNSADGTLWYFESVRAYYAASRDIDLLQQLFPVLETVIQEHLSGTRFGILMDPEDGLLRAGVDGVALTWMDAVVGNHVMTPRIGKPVELGALWFNSLSIMSTFSKDLGNDRANDQYSALAYRAEMGFRRRFWNEEKGYCFDVVDGPNGQVDSRLLPNQLLACSLQWSPLTLEQRLQIVEACSQELLTSYAIRTLPQGEESYVGIYDGDIFSRDRAYHCGTAWTWLMGPFVVAHLRAYGNRKAARSFLLPMLDTLRSAGQGTLSEIFDGDAPYRPRGCIAQAWSVSEFLRAWLETEPDSKDLV